MAARRRGRTWSSSRRRRAKGTWFADSAYGLVAPTTGVADTDAVLGVNDYSVTPGSKDRVRIRRIILDFWWTPVTPTAPANGAASFVVDFALVVCGADTMANVVVAAARMVDWTTFDARLIRGTAKPFTEQSALTQVGVIPAVRRPIQLSWNIRTNIPLVEPQQLYIYQLRTDVDSTSDSYEYSYNCRTYFER